ncbi:MAG: sigma-54-dependent Fis family transcriptional regulator [Desulfobacteraceae bacterium]|nr:sigma-54-dependent Fis family transcriptional regulator [Desulfobacteraceae bacterium]
MSSSDKKNINPHNPILIVDDQRVVMTFISRAMELAGYDNLICCLDEREVMDTLDDREVEVILLDLVMPYIPGEELLVEIRARYPETPVIMATSLDDTSTVVRCMKKGAYDYITKPFDEELLIAAVQRAIAFRELARQNARLSKNLLSGSPIHSEYFKEIITNSPKMKPLFRYCEATAPGKEPVLITGETGTGKELMARAFHAASNRKGEFVAVNVAGVDDHVFSDTLFGHEKGAFTGAEKPRRGFINKAAGGTLFLDEIGELSEQSQIKLLRVIQEKEFLPLGSDRPIATDARIIIATHKHLDELQAKGEFRQDLFFRLRTHHLEIPPLRARPEDIPLLLEFFLELASREFNKKKPTYPPELVQLLRIHPFPGNVRELRAMVYDAVARHTSKTLSTEAFKKYIFPKNQTLPSVSPTKSENIFAGLDSLPTLKTAADSLVDEAMHRSGSNQKIAAAMLGITPPALSKRLKQRIEKASENLPN